MYLAVRLLVAWGVNVLALIVADWVFSGFTIERWGSLLFAGAVFGLANVFLKPLLTFIAIPLIILTSGSRTSSSTSRFSRSRSGSSRTSRSTASGRTSEP